jgi:UDP-N-acetylmuramate dehydrogenase
MTLPLKPHWRDTLPPVRGRITRDAALAPFTWFRVGGQADVLFTPADEDDLCDFLRGLDAGVPVTPLGVGSNTIVRDGGIEGVVVRLIGRPWGEVCRLDETRIEVGAGALDASVARFAADAGLAGLGFLSGVPGTMGGAVRTNAGCYGRELVDVLDTLTTVTRRGGKRVWQGPRGGHDHPRLHLTYRHSDLPEDEIVTRLILRGEPGGEPDALRTDMSTLQARREASQPIREKTGGSTFANPDPPGTPDARSAWRLVDGAGCRGLRVGGAQVSDKHANFLINTGAATAADIEALGELVRARVLETSGVALRWEIRRIGRLQALKEPNHET